MSDVNKSGMNDNGIIAGLIITIVILFLTVACILGYNLFTKTLGLENKEIVLWLIFMLIAAAISCLSDVIISLVSKKSKENREKSIVQEIKSFLTEKTDEITSTITLKQTGLVSGDQNNILAMLMNRCLENGEIVRIRILAHNSDSFSCFFTDYFKKREFECKELNILVHNQEIDKNSDVVKEWYSLYRNKKINILKIRQARIDRRSFFGMIIDSESYHRIGLIGFYKPQDADKNQVFPYKQYGVFNEGDSILDVLNEYFNHYFDSDSATKLKEEVKNRLV